MCKHKMNDGELLWSYIVLDNGSPSSQKGQEPLVLDFKLLPE